MTSQTLGSSSIDAQPSDTETSVNARGKQVEVVLSSQMKIGIQTPGESSDHHTFTRSMALFFS